MAIKDILVHVDSSPHASARLAAGVRLAASQGARLTGFHVMTPPDVPGFVRAHLGDGVVERQHQLLEEAAEKARTVFEAACAGSSIEIAWKTAEGDLSDNLCRQGRYHDLILLGRHDVDSDVQPGSEKLPDSVIMTSGRPVMVVPATYTGGEIGRSLLIAWDGSRQAVRAVGDSLPLLVSAERVVVLVVGRHPVGSGHGDESSGAALTDHLRHHGIKAESLYVSAEEQDIGSIILDWATSEDCDGIVMGAWGHQRWKETVLGGVTRHMMAHMDRPIIMSH